MEPTQETAKLKDLVAYVAIKTDTTHELAHALVTSTLQGIMQLTTDYGSLSIRDFGKFELRTRNARTHPNPIDGRTTEIPAKLLVCFTTSRRLVRKMQEGRTL